jgi:hypothetical protein
VSPRVDTLDPSLSTLRSATVRNQRPASLPAATELINCLNMVVNICPVRPLVTRHAPDLWHERLLHGCIVGLSTRGLVRVCCEPVPPTPLCRFLYSDRTRVSQPWCVRGIHSTGASVSWTLSTTSVWYIGPVICGLPQSQVGTSCFHKTCHGSLCALGPIPRVYEGSGIRSQGVRCASFVDQLAGQWSPFPFGYVECAAYGGALKYLRTNYVLCVRCLVNLALVRY